ncbi:hypothetical protein [Caloramator sp. ALD01]|uniref:hypothetical protein n=1 Tax=Caloramator sp. ALD01 TaxID=1031288 RepID=UPI000485A820|nr:hypothetical protein [Caloramator sp. ALD01]
MSENLRGMTEIVFNITYLFLIWLMVIKMKLNKVKLQDKQQKVGGYLLLAFFLLALGDTGHVGFRAYAYMLGGIEKYSVLVGYGALATAITVTLFYIVFLYVWRYRFNKEFGIFHYFLIALGLLRIFILFLPQNNWSSLNQPYIWSLIRNIPLTIQGLSVAFLMYIDAQKTKDITFRWISIMIFVSYICYIPVILFNNINPMIGLLMIPKTIAYLLAGYIGYRGVYIKSYRY